VRPPRARLLAVAGELFLSAWNQGGRGRGDRRGGRHQQDDALSTTLPRRTNWWWRVCGKRPSWRTACWDRFAQVHPGNALAQLRAWLREMADHVANTDERGCALANAAVELPEKDHPARRVIEQCKTAHRNRLIACFISLRSRRHSTSTADNNVNRLTRSRWSRALRYAWHERKASRDLRTFLRENGGPAGCADQFAAINPRGRYPGRIVYRCPGTGRPYLIVDKTPVGAVG
jgi:hypothetical protein